jgi:hypothetical protein
MTRPPFEVADIIRAHGNSLIEKSRSWLTWLHIRVLFAIEHCRTATSGSGVLAISIPFLRNWLLSILKIRCSFRRNSRALAPPSHLAAMGAAIATSDAAGKPTAATRSRTAGGGDHAGDLSGELLPAGVDQPHGPVAMVN